LSRLGFFWTSPKIRYGDDTHEAPSSSTPRASIQEVHDDDDDDNHNGPIDDGDNDISIKQESQAGNTNKQRQRAGVLRRQVPQDDESHACDTGDGNRSNKKQEPWQATTTTTKKNNHELRQLAWDNFYQLLLEYQLDHDGDLDVPQKYETKNGYKVRKQAVWCVMASPPREV
jgi:hypothetical protein